MKTSDQINEINAKKKIRYEISQLVKPIAEQFIGKYFIGNHGLKELDKPEYHKKTESYLENLFPCGKILTWGRNKKGVIYYIVIWNNEAIIIPLFFADENYLITGFCEVEEFKPKKLHEICKIQAQIDDLQDEIDRLKNSIKYYT